MVQIEALIIPECQEGVLSQDGQQREEHRVVQHVQLEQLTRTFEVLVYYIPDY